MTVLLSHWAPTTVDISKMLESGVVQFQLALKEPSDSKEAQPLLDVLRSVTTMSGAQCVMTCGVLLMPKWLADSWDSAPLVSM